MIKIGSSLSIFGTEDCLFPHMSYLALMITLLISFFLIFLVAGAIFLFRKSGKHEKPNPKINICFDDMKAKESGRR